MVETLSVHRLDIFMQVQESEANLFIKELYNKPKMKNKAKEIDQVLGSWIKEHQQKRAFKHQELEQDFKFYVFVTEPDQSAQKTDIAMKST